MSDEDDQGTTCEICGERFPFDELHDLGFDMCGGSIHVCTQHHPDIHNGPDDVAPDYVGSQALDEQAIREIAQKWNFDETVLRVQLGVDNDGLG